MDTSVTVSLSANPGPTLTVSRISIVGTRRAMARMRSSFAWRNSGECNRGGSPPPSFVRSALRDLAGRPSFDGSHGHLRAATESPGVMIPTVAFERHPRQHDHSASPHGNQDAR